MTFPIHPEAASSVARQTDHLYWAFVLLSALVCFAVFGPMIYFLFKYRRGRPADRSPRPLPQNAIEISWTVLPTLILLGFYAWSAGYYFNIERPPSGAMEINVIGKQWMWKIQHPEGNREIDELHVPVGRIVKLTMTSQDVIHSFFLPAFRIKQDVVPGRYTTEWFKADRVGSYHLFCSEYCGTMHSGMTGRIVVMEPDAYQQWLTRGQPQATLASDGARLYRDLGCSGCHSGSTVLRAPPLEGLFGKPVPLQSGEVTTADETYLRDSILFPDKQITAGYTNAMPSFNRRLSEDQLLELIAYIKSLGSTAPTAATSYESRLNSPCSGPAAIQKLSRRRRQHPPLVAADH
jgi:cytochrome c oxidase subunit II